MMQNVNEQLMKLIDASPTAYHAIDVVDIRNYWKVKLGI